MVPAPVPKTVFLHVGAFKSGTTYLQNVLWASRDQLAADGICFPGTGGWRSQGLAAMDVTASAQNRLPASRGAWRRLVQEVKAWDGPTVVVSAERLSFARPGQIERVLESLQAIEVHVVLTVRDLARTVPASWQERLKNGKAWSWPDFLAGIRDPALADQEPGRGFWRQQDFANLLQDWEKAVPRDRIHVVTVPPAGSPPHVLLDRFGHLIGSDPTTWTADVERVNESLGVAEAELLRRLNPLVTDVVAHQPYERFVKFGLARDVLSRRAGQRRVALPADQLGWVREQSRDQVARLLRRGYHVVGDLDDLLPSAPAAETSRPSDADVPVEEVLEVALDAVAALVHRLASSNEELQAWLNEGRSRLP